MGKKNASVAILFYHRVCSDKSPISISPQVFSAQMRYLSEHFNPLSLTEVVDRLWAGAPLPSQGVVVTFDDGYRDNFLNAFPILKSFGIPATFFLPAGMMGKRDFFWWDRIRLGLKPIDEVVSLWPSLSEEVLGRSRQQAIGRITEVFKRLDNREAIAMLDRICDPVSSNSPEVMNWSEIRKLAASGMEIGSHTMTHPILSRQTFEEACAEIRESKTILERELQKTIQHFAFPNGRPCDFSPALIAILEEAGFRSACSTVHGRVDSLSTPFSLERLRVSERFGLLGFRARIAGCRNPFEGG